MPKKTIAAWDAAARKNFNALKAAMQTDADPETIRRANQALADLSAGTRETGRTVTIKRERLEQLL